MKKESFWVEFFGLRREQRENQKKILRALSLIIGSIFIAEGVMSMFPEGFEKIGLISIGVILIIISVLD